ncbi:hypothetical protein HN014_08180 [Aquimarina sp. TRL1]|uniref:hypothetical protein n=1 Tax=Aquimarina sp. (strain TRL1) TaxID=2736252 RepID=UPI0015886905|nr:hypothetical protein [Aquimarina sp. TRL1]QKX04896.1 hypothetical protein HN014_08180 [Aquimarina sp. TRL1]
MDSLEFYQGGFPLETNTLEFIQSQTTMVAALSALGGGDTYILSGVTKQNDTVTDGVIVYKGEILPFKGGTIQPDVTIVEEVQKVKYASDQDGDGERDEKIAYRKRYVRFGSDGAKIFRFSALKPFIEGITSQIFKTFFKDIRLPYVGAIEDIPKGWELCELFSGHFPAIFDPSNPDYNEILKTGGENTVTLTEDQLPKHSHSGRTNASGNHSHSGRTSAAGAHSHTGRTNAAGAHSHTGRTNTAGRHRHDVPAEKHQNGEGVHFKIENYDRRSQKGRSAGDHSHSLLINSNGEHSHTVDIASSGAHTHPFTTNTVGSHSHSFTTNEKGEGLPHENRPKYKVFALIKPVY